MGRRGGRGRGSRGRWWPWRARGLRRRGEKPGTGRGTGGGSGGGGARRLPLAPDRMAPTAGLIRSPGACGSRAAAAHARTRSSGTPRPGAAPRPSRPRQSPARAATSRTTAAVPEEMDDTTRATTSSRPRVPAAPVLRRIEVKGLAGSWEAEWGTAGRPPQLTGASSPSHHRAPGTGSTSSSTRSTTTRVDDLPDPDRRTASQPLLLDHGWKEAAERPAGPGLRPARETVSRPLPDTEPSCSARDDRDEGDVPYVDWLELPEALDRQPRRTERVMVHLAGERRIDGDFAVQQRDGRWARPLPYGAIAVFRPRGRRPRDVGRARRGLPRARATPPTPSAAPI